MWNLKKQKQKTKENQADKYREQIGGGQSWRGWGLGEMGEGSQMVPNSNYENISYGDIMYSMVTIVDNTWIVYLKVVNLKSFHHKKKNCIVTGVN